MDPWYHLPRLAIWSLITSLMLVLLWLISPVQLPVVLYKLVMVTLGAVVGYWIDRELFPYARPHVMPKDSLRHSLATLRRALIVLACILGLTLGL